MSWTILTGAVTGIQHEDARTGHQNAFVIGRRFCAVYVLVLSSCLGSWERFQVCLTLHVRADPYDTETSSYSRNYIRVNLFLKRYIGFLRYSRCLGP
jgi:hypothetical protein